MRREGSAISLPEEVTCSHSLDEYKKAFPQAAGEAEITVTEFAEAPSLRIRELETL